MGRAVNLDVDRFLEDLTGRHARAYFRAVQDMVVAMATGDRTALSKARRVLADVITETMGVGEVLGASIALRKASKASTEEGLFRADTRTLVAFADAPTQTILPRVTFQEAVDDMVARTPVTIRRAAERTAQRIAQLYGEGRVVAFARSAEAAVTERVQSLIEEAVREGIPEADMGARIVRNVDYVRENTGAWSESYARMSFRTNVNTAVTAGRFRQAQDPDVMRVVPCMQFDAVDDGDTRPNHAAGDGIVMLVTNPHWNKVASPLGYNCRCQTNLVMLPMLRRMGRVQSDGSIREDRPPSAWRPDPGFRHGGRPDLFMVGAA